MSDQRPLTAPMVTFRGEEERDYVTWAVRALRAARLNNQYPDPRALMTHIGAMSPDAHRGLYDGIQVQLPSGLPSYKEWTRIQTDAQLAKDVLDDLPPESELRARAAADPESIYARQLAKHGYYGELVGKTFATLGDMDVKLRRVVPESKTAFFHVVLDKLDASGLFVRYTIDLAQRSSAWGRSIVRLDQEHARHTEELRTLIYRCTSLDSEFTLVKLAALSGVAVERVIKGTVGPFFIDPDHAPGDVAELLREHPGARIATFASDTAAIDISEDRDNDPLEGILLERLSEQGREGYESARRKLKYHVFKDRKFVVGRSFKRPLRDWLASAGTKNIVYTI